MVGVNNSATQIGETGLSYRIIDGLPGEIDKLRRLFLFIPTNAVWPPTERHVLDHNQVLGGLVPVT